MAQSSRQRDAALTFQKDPSAGEVNDFNLADGQAPGAGWASKNSEKMPERWWICFLRQMARETWCSKYICQVVSGY